MRKHSRWEQICRRCGRCCYEKIEFEGEVYYTDQPCPYLDLETRLCTVYDRRSRVKPDCMPLSPRVLGMGVLPDDCPYVAGRDNYPAPHLWDTWDEEAS
ncbi:hypothetical protein [Geothermobacter hydrogeniphilus]|uniref:Uncharacterized protein n=1 Tax=Geothermobacter hydrogeniphilus TaxID=1969733 RepID=A0A1X0YDP3_9BACT|nr:hypothetical protein [Geothermobacter hydrogeniphilus]ORJ63310.1 hypothetical protein B5V00_00125 [Geothermobacter hydrogeniphilus]